MPVPSAAPAPFVAEPARVVTTPVAVTVGPGSSKVTEEAFVVVVKGVPALPARSLNARENATAPAASPAAIVPVAV